MYFFGKKHPDPRLPVRVDPAEIPINYGSGFLTRVIYPNYHFWEAPLVWGQYYHFQKLGLMYSQGH